MAGVGARRSIHGSGLVLCAPPLAGPTPSLTLYRTHSLSLILALSHTLSLSLAHTLTHPGLTPSSYTKR